MNEQTNIPFIDPVCGMSIEPSKAAAKTVFQSKEYFFCSLNCKEKFGREPIKYSR